MTNIFKQTWTDNGDGTQTVTGPSGTGIWNTVTGSWVGAGRPGAAKVDWSKYKNKGPSGGGVAPNSRQLSEILGSGVEMRA